MKFQSDIATNDLLAKANAAIASGDYRKAIEYHLELMGYLSQHDPGAVDAFSQGPYANLLVAAASHAMELTRRNHFIDALDLINDIRVYFSNAPDEMIQGLDHIKQYCIHRAPYNRSSARANDVLLCCAEAENDELQSPLASALRDLGVLVAEEPIVITGRPCAMDLTERLSESDALIVVLSPDFFSSAWPQEILDGLLSSSGSDAALVLPVWHCITRPEVLAASEPLERTLAFDTVKSSITEIAQGIADIVRPDLASGVLHKLIWASILQGKVLGEAFSDFELPVRQTSLDEDLIDRIRLIRAAFLDGCRQTMTAWVDGFSRELDPYSAVVEWEGLARAFHDCREFQRQLRANTEAVLVQLIPTDIDRAQRNRMREMAMTFARCPSDRLFMLTWLDSRPWGKYADVGFPAEALFINYLLGSGIRIAPVEDDFETQWRRSASGAAKREIQVVDYDFDGKDWGNGVLHIEEERLSSKPWDVFISHASEDKAQLVRPLADALKDYGVKVWYDTFNLRPGLSLNRSIDAGIAGAEFGIVVLSPHFIAKEWPRYEFDSLSQRRTERGDRLITLWHGLSPEIRPDWTQGLDAERCMDSAELPLTAMAMRLVEWVRPDIARFSQRRLDYSATQEKQDHGELKTKHVDISQLNPSKRRFERLPPALEARVNVLRAVLSEGEPHSMAYWLDGFLRDYYPEGQIKSWERIAAMYQEAICVVDWMQKAAPKRSLLGFARKQPEVNHSDVYRILNRLLHSQDPQRDLAELRRKYPEDVVNIIAGIASSPSVIDFLED